LVLALLLSTPAAAQPTPPPYLTGNNTFYWSWGAFTTDWHTGDNWYSDYGPYNGLAPIENADVVFGLMGLDDTPQVINQNQASLKLRSLWFGNEANYTISGANNASPLLGGGLANNGHLITVLAEDATADRVHTINQVINLAQGTKTFQIGNYSQGKLRFLHDFDAKGNSLKLINLGTLNFAKLSGLADLTITDSDTTTFEQKVAATGDFSFNNAQTTHFKGEVSGINDLTITDSDTTIFLAGVKVANAVVVKNSRLTFLGTRIHPNSAGPDFYYLTTGKTLSVSSDSANHISTVLLYAVTGQPGFTNSINVGANALLIYNEIIFNNVGLTPKATVFSGGTLQVNARYTPKLKSITLSGDGVTRQDGTASLGALYATRDGGIASPTTVNLNGDTSINVGSNKWLQIVPAIAEATDSSVSSLRKSGSGDLQLNQTGTWKGTTIIDKGSLTLYGVGTALPTGNLVLSGGILQFGYQAADFSRTLGTGANEVRWTGDGGFSAYVNDVSVSLGAGGLTWGSGNFVPDGSALLLGSRFGTHQISLTNAINLGSELREVRVERGTDNYTNANSLGRLTGALSGTGGLRRPARGFCGS